MKIKQCTMWNQRGDSPAMTILIIVVLFSVAFFGWKLGVPYFKYAQLAHFIKIEVNYDRENFKANPTLVQSVWNKVLHRAQTLKIPINEKELKADYEEDRIWVIADYEYPVDLIITKFNWHFHIEKESEGIGFVKDL